MANNIRKYGKSIEDIRKQTIAEIKQEVKKTISKDKSATKSKLVDFIKDIQCK